MINDDKANDQAAPLSVVDAGQEIVVVWQDARSGDYDIYSSLSYDNGTKFGANKRADDSVNPSLQIEATAAVSKNGTIYVAWQDNRRCVYDFDVFFTRSYDRGRQFAKNARVDDGGTAITSQEWPSIAVTDGGLISVAWTDDRSGHMRVRYSYSLDGGETFSPSSEIAPSNGTNGQGGAVLASDGDQVYAAFIDNVSGAPHPYLSISKDGGRTFGPPIRLDGSGDAGAWQNDVAIAALRSGGVAAVWEDKRNGQWDIYGCVVSASGSFVVPGTRVDDDATGSLQKDPSVATDQLGNVYAVWEDDRNLKFAVRFAYLKSGATTFSPSMEVSPPGPNDMQRRPTVASTEPGRVFIVWQDDKGGSYDVYSSAAFFPELRALRLSKGWNFVSIPYVDHGFNASTLGLLTGDIVVSWNPATQAYDKTYVVGVSPAFRDFPIADSTGYWIYASDDETLQLRGNLTTTVQSRSVVLPAGGGYLNVGFNTLNTTRHASDIVGMFGPGHVKQVVWFNPATGLFKTYNPLLPFTDFRLLPGQAYWVLADSSGTLTYLP